MSSGNYPAAQINASPQSMFSELYRTGLFTGNTYGAFLVVAFFAGVGLTAYVAGQEGINRSRVYSFCLYLLIAAILGAKFLLVLTEWNRYVINPKELFSSHFISSQGVFYGGLIASVTCSLYLAHGYQWYWWQIADICAPGIALGQFFGRLGCFSVGCCWGKPTISWLGVHFTEQAHQISGVPIHTALHPTQLYESFATLGICLSLLYLRRYRIFHGQIILTYLLSYGLIRFVLEFLRNDPRGAIWIFSTSQMIALLFIISAIISLIYRHHKHTHYLPIPHVSNSLPT